MMQWSYREYGSPNRVIPQIRYNSIDQTAQPFRCAATMWPHSCSKMTPVVRAKDRECQRGILNCAEEDDRSKQKHGPVDEYSYPPDLHYLYQFV